MATQFFCDSNCELHYTDIEELGINLIKMPYILDGEEFDNDLGKTVDMAHFYKRLSEGATPTTSALNEFTYTEIFEPVFEAGDDILYVSFSSEMSATFNFMQKAVDALLEKYPNRKFHWFDTKSISLGTGIQVYESAKLFKEGKSVEEILAFLNDFTNKNKTIFAVDDLFHLKRGGRLSGVAATVGSMLNLKPILTVTTNGKLEVLKKVKGKNLVYKHFIDDFKENARDISKYTVWIMHANCEDRADEIEKRIMEASDNKAVVRKILVGPVVASHCGIGTLGLIFASNAR